MEILPASPTAFDTDLVPGAYQLVVTSDYHERVERSLTIAADEDTNLTIDLPGITGTLRATMTPRGTMLVDGQPVDSGTSISLAPARIKSISQLPATNLSATALPSPRHSVISSDPIICNRFPSAFSINSLQLVAVYL